MTTAPPEGAPLARPATKPAGVPRVASNVQPVPLAERYTSTAGLRATVAGRNRTNPSAVTATPLIWAWAPCPAGALGGTASVQVPGLAPPLPLSQAALVGGSGVWPAAGATSPAMRIWFPEAAAYLMPRTRLFRLVASLSCAAPRRCQVDPLADRKITGVASAGLPSGTLDPAAMKPAAVRSSTLI